MYDVVHTTSVQVAGVSSPAVLGDDHLVGEGLELDPEVAVVQGQLESLLAWLVLRLVQSVV